MSFILLAVCKNSFSYSQKANRNVILLFKYAKKCLFENCNLLKYTVKQANIYE